MVAVGNLTTNYHHFRKDHAERMRERDQQRSKAASHGVVSVDVVCVRLTALVDGGGVCVLQLAGRLGRRGTTARTR